MGKQTTRMILLLATLISVTGCGRDDDAAVQAPTTTPQQHVQVSEPAAHDAAKTGTGAADDNSARQSAERIVVAAPKTRQEATQRLDAYLAMVDDLSKLVGEEDVDIDGLLDKLDYEPERIIAFVQNNIRFEQYQGALRGARNTLRGLAGNSLDQSLLLATLLKDAGFDARIVSANVENALINALVATNGHGDPAGSADASITPDGLVAVITKHATGMGLDDHAIKQLIEQVHAGDRSKRAKALSDSKLVASALRKSLEENGVSLAPTVEDAKGTTTYYWVSFREGENRPWSDIHTNPSLPEAIEALAPTSTYAGEIPGSLQHRVRVEVLVEQMANAKPKLTSLGAWERPSANLPDTPISVQIFPMSWMSTNSVWLRQDVGAPDRDIFHVVINGKPLDSSFDTSGNIIPADAAASNYAALFATVSDKVNGAAGLLGQLGGTGELDRSQHAVTLSAVILRYSFNAPDGKTRSFDRRIFSADMPELDGKEFAINSRVGREMLTRQFLLHYTTYQHSEREAIRFMLARARRLAEAYRSGITLDTDDATGGWGGSGIVFSLFDASAVASKAYRDTPHLVVYSSTPGIFAARREFIDVVNNHRAIRTPANAAIAVEQGTWESLVEGSLINAEPVLTATGQTFQIVRSESALQDLSARLGTFGRKSAAANLRDGYVLAFPAQPGSQRWWRVGSDGETLRIMIDGSGGDTLEYVPLEQAGRVITCLNAVHGGCGLLAKMGSAAAMVGQRAEILGIMLDIAEGIGVTDTGVGNAIDPALGTGGALVLSAGYVNAAATNAFFVCRDRLAPKCFRP